MRVNGKLVDTQDIIYNDSEPSVPLNIPVNLDTVKIVVHSPSKEKLIVIHMYPTQTNILVQGKFCIDWVKEEFRRLQGVVHTLMEADSSEPTDVKEAWQQANLDLSLPPVSGLLSPVTEEEEEVVISPPLSSTCDIQPDCSLSMESTSCVEGLQSDQPSTSTSNLITISSNSSVISTDLCVSNERNLSSLNKSDIPAFTSVDAETSANILDPKVSSIETMVSQLMQELTNCKHDFSLYKTQMANDARVRFQELSNEVQSLQNENAALKLNLVKLERRCQGLEDAHRDIKKCYKQSLPQCSSVGTQSVMLESNVSVSDSLPVDDLHRQSFSSSPPPAVHISSSKKTSSLNHSVSSDHKECRASHDSTGDEPISFSNAPPPSRTVRLPSSCQRVILGDSNLKNLGKRRLDTSGNTDIRTFRGASISHLDEILRNSSISSHVEEVVLSVGTNDCSSRHTNCNQFLDDYDSLISTALTTFPHAIIYVAAIMPQSNPRQNITIWDINEDLEMLCRERDQGRSEILFLPFPSIWRDVSEDGKVMKDILADRLHLSTRGIALFAKAIKGCLSIPVAPTNVRAVNGESKKSYSGSLTKKPQQIDPDHQKLQGHLSDQHSEHQNQPSCAQKSQVSPPTLQVAASAHSTSPSLHQPTPSSPSVPSHQQPAQYYQQSHSSVPHQDHANHFASFPYYPWSPYSSHQLRSFLQFPHVWNQLPMRHPVYGCQAGLSQPLSPPMF